MNPFRSECGVWNVSNSPRVTQLVTGGSCIHSGVKSDRSWIRRRTIHSLINKGPCNSHYLGCATLVKVTPVLSFHIWKMGLTKSTYFGYVWLRQISQLMHVKQLEQYSAYSRNLANLSHNLMIIMIIISSSVINRYGTIKAVVLSI